MTAGVHFITVIGEVGEEACVEARDNMVKDVPGALPDVLANHELFTEITKNRGFVAIVVMLTDSKNQLLAARNAKVARGMGVGEVKVVCCG